MTGGLISCQSRGFDRSERSNSTWDMYYLVFMASTEYLLDALLPKVESRVANLR